MKENANDCHSSNDVIFFSLLLLLQGNKIEIYT